VHVGTYLSPRGLSWSVASSSKFPLAPLPGNSGAARQVGLWRILPKTEGRRPMTHCNSSILLRRQGSDTEKTIKGQKSALSGRNPQRAVGAKCGKSLKQLGISE
jgi:hypothetical protein